MLEVEKIVNEDGSKMLTVKVPRETGICAKEINIFLEKNGVFICLFVIFDKNNKIDDLVVIGGCAGNLSAVANLIKGMDANEVINKLEYITCGKKNTSCPNEIANILKVFI